MTADTDIICNMLRKLAKPSADLSSYATEDAVETLLENWKAAMRDGVALQGLVADVDGVIEHLKDFRNGIVAIYPEAKPRDDQALTSSCSCPISSCQDLILASPGEN
jgi:hypothetical protein